MVSVDVDVQLPDGLCPEVAVLAGEHGVARAVGPPGRLRLPLFRHLLLPPCRLDARRVLLVKGVVLVAVAVVLALPLLVRARLALLLRQVDDRGHELRAVDRTGVDLNNIPVM